MAKKIPPWLWVVAAFCSLNILTCNWYTSVWMDEAMFVDPAANLYYGHGFTSTAWATQRFGEFWAGNTPLYSVLIYFCFKTFGFGIVQVRVLDYLLWSGAVALICLAVQRSRLIRHPALVAMLAALLFSGDGVVFNYRSARYDPAIVLVAAACFWAFTIESRRLRTAVIFFTASCFLPTALILGPFAAVFGGMLFLFMGRRYFFELCCVASGLVIGLSLLYLFYGELGLWHTFRNATSYLAQIYYPPGQTMPVWEQKLITFPRKLFHDLATVALLLCLLGMAFFKWSKLGANSRRLTILGIVTFLVIPAVSQAAYAYQPYHTWQAYIPMTVCLVGVLDQSGDMLKVSFRRSLMVALILVIFTFGLGARLGLALTDLEDRDYSKVESFVRATVHPSDVVFADHQAFYPLHKLNVTTYYFWYLHVITRQEADSINCLIINPGWFAFCKEKIGGEWYATGERYLNGNKFNIGLFDHLLPVYFNQQSNNKYNLVVYRRLPGHGVTANQAQLQP